MLIILGTIKLESADEADRLAPALQRRAERSRRDEGNLDYVFTRNLAEPSEIRLIEKWTNEASLNAHLQQADEEFDRLLASAKIERAVVVASEISGERELLKR